MKRNAFTLVEILVVVSIIALLVAILLPALGAARALGRKAVCAANLHHIAAGFGMHKAREQQAGRVESWFPEHPKWPGVPMDVVDAEGVFICPEMGENSFGSADYLSAMTYLNRPRGLEIPMSSVEGLGHMWVGYRRGKDKRGAYMEIGTDDNEPVTDRLLDYDGHDGIIRVYDEQPGGRVTAVLVKYSCGEHNCVLYNGQPLFPDETYTNPNDSRYGWLGPGTSKVGMEVDLASSACSYGININASYFRKTAYKAVVLDYDTRLVRPDDSDIGQKLSDAARHRGKINVLFADNSVGSVGPMEIDPRIPGSESVWWP